jgi:integrase
MADARQHAKRWSYSVGERGRNRVRAFEHQKTGRLFLEYYEPSRASERPAVKRVALGHRERERAKAQAEELAAKLRSATPPATAHISLAALFDIYLREVTPGKREGKQQHDRASAAMFLKAFGRDREARSLTRREWDRFIRDRRAGVLRPAGVKKRRAVGSRVVGYDLSWLLAVLNWATLASDGRGGVLLERNPLKGLELPREANPRRPLVNEEEFQQLLEVADRVHSCCRLALLLAHETGHRASAIRQLRWSDVDLQRRVIRWRAELDKIGFEHETPLTPEAIGVLETTRATQRAIGDAWIFRDPTNPGEPCGRNHFVHWWRRAEELSGIARVKHRGWHALRRKFATELKAVPLKDLCELGGWKEPQTVLRCYMKPDEETMRTALEQRRRSRAGDVG